MKVQSLLTLIDVTLMLSRSALCSIIIKKTGQQHCHIYPNLMGEREIAFFSGGAVLLLFDSRF
jgi:hypothetical protein